GAVSAPYASLTVPPITSAPLPSSTQPGGVGVNLALPEGAAPAVPAKVIGQLKPPPPPKAEAIMPNPVDGVPRAEIALTVPDPAEVVIKLVVTGAVVPEFGVS